MYISEAVWVRCCDCEDVVCNYHMMHIADCECPGIDVWAEAGINPYATVLNSTIGDWIETHPFIHEDELPEH